MLDSTKPGLEPALAFLRELWALNHALGSTSKRMHDRIGVTAQQRMVLRFLGKRPGITASDLAEILHLERGTLSQALKRLEEKGLISRRSDPSDLRKTFIRLSKKGAQLDTPTIGTVERAVDRTLKEASEGDVEIVRRFLHRLRHHLGGAT